MSTIYLNKTIETIIAKPKYKDIVLYNRVDGQIEKGENSFIARDEKLIKSLSAKCNSPDNLRRLFITNKEVHLQYFQPIMGSSDKRLWRNYVIQEEFGDMQKRFGMFKTGKTALDIERANQNNDMSKIIGNGLRALSRPWVYQNIEEIYFDWLPFTTYRSKAMEPVSIVKLYDKSQANNLSYYRNFMVWMLGIPEVATVEQLRKKFPRLHTMGYIENLEDMLSNEEKYKTPANEIGEPWYFPSKDKSKPIAVAPSYMIVRLVTNKEQWITDYSCKTGTYIFDAQILDSYFTKLVDKLKEEKTPKEIKSEITEIEKTITKIADNAGDGAAAATMYSMLSTKDITPNKLMQELSVDFKANRIGILNKLNELIKG